MGKRLRYILLSFTLVLAIFVFALLWQVRPGFDSKLLDEARARQKQTLLEVQKPLETDLTVLSEEEEMAQKVSAILKGDADFLATVSAKVEEAVPAYVEQYADEYVSTLRTDIENQIVSEVSSTILSEKDSIYADIEATILAEVDSRIQAKENELVAYLDGKESELIEFVTTEVYNQFEQKKNELADEIVADVDALVSDRIATAKDETKAEIEQYILDQKDYFVSLVADSFAQNMLLASEGALDDERYDEIVYNVSSGIMAGLAGDRSVAVEEMDSYETNTALAIENIVMAVLDRIDLSVVEAAEESVAPASFEDEAVQAEEIAVPEKPVVATAPSFSVDSSNDYAVERDRIRRAEIERVLAGLID